MLITNSCLSPKRQHDKHRKKVVFKEGDLVWIYLRKERFPNRRFAKFQPRADGPFKIIKKINANAYNVELPGTHGVSATFNVSDLSPYEVDGPLDSRTSPLQPGENDTQVALDKPKPSNYDEDLGWPKPDVISNGDLQAHLSLVTQEITMDKSHVFHQPNI